MSRFRVPRGIEVGRLWVNDGWGYVVQWYLPLTLWHVVVKRVSDGQVVGYGRVDEGWFRTVGFDEWEEAIMSFLRRVAEKDQAMVGTPTKEGEAWVKNHAALWEYLSATEYDDGTERKTSTVTLFVEDGAVKVCLNDRDGSRVMWVSGPSVVDVLKALEALLRAGEGDWRAQKPFKPGKGQKRS